jgi:hypothetical protein
MAVAAIAARPSTPPTTLPAITAVLSVEDEVDMVVGAFVEAEDEGVEEVVEGVIEGGKEIVEGAVEGAEEVVEGAVEGAGEKEVVEDCWVDCWIDERAEVGEAAVEKAADTVADAVDAAVLEDRLAKAIEQISLAILLVATFRQNVSSFLVPDLAWSYLSRKLRVKEAYVLNASEVEQA